MGAARAPPVVPCADLSRRAGGGLGAFAVGDGRGRLSGEHRRAAQRRVHGADLSERPRAVDVDQAGSRGDRAWLSRRADVSARSVWAVGQRRLADVGRRRAPHQARARGRGEPAVATAARAPFGDLARRARPGAAGGSERGLVERAAARRRPSEPAGRDAAAAAEAGVVAMAGDALCLARGSSGCCCAGDRVEDARRAAVSLAVVASAASFVVAVAFSFDAYASPGTWIASVDEVFFLAIGVWFLLRGPERWRGLAAIGVGLLAMAVGISKGAIFFHPIVLAVLPGTRHAARGDRRRGRRSRRRDSRRRVVQRGALGGGGAGAAPAARVEVSCRAHDRAWQLPGDDPPAWAWCADAGRGAGCSPAALHARVRRARRRRAGAPGARVSAFAGAVDRAVDRRGGRRVSVGARARARRSAIRCRATRCRSPVCGSCARRVWSGSMSARSSSRVCSRPAIPVGWPGSSAMAAGGRSRRRCASAWCSQRSSTAPGGCSTRSRSAAVVCSAAGRLGPRGCLVLVMCGRRGSRRWLVAGRAAVLRAKT